MLPKPIPQKLLDESIGIPCKFDPPPGREKEVGSLQVLILEDTKAVLQGREPQAAQFISWWQPSQAELEKLVKGASVRLVLIGCTHINPMRIEVGNSLEGILFSPQSNGGL